MKVHYEFARDGITGARNFSDVDVSEELGAVLMELDREEYNHNRKETRRHESLNTFCDKQETFVDKSIDIEAESITKSELSLLHNAIRKLKPKEQQIIHWLYLSDNPLSQAEVGKRLGIAEDSVKKSALRIRNKLRLILEKII